MSENSPKEVTAKDLLFSTGEGSVPYNRTVAKAIGVDPAIVLSVLVDRHYFHKERNELVENAWFYCTIYKLQQLSCLTEKLQNSAIKILEDLKLIEKAQKGDRGKRHFKIHIEKIKAFLQDKEQLTKLIALPKKQRRSATKQLLPNEGSELLPNEEVNIANSDELTPPLEVPNSNNQQAVISEDSEIQFSDNQTNKLLYAPVYEYSNQLPNEIIGYLTSRIANQLHNKPVKYEMLIKNLHVVVEKWELVCGSFSITDFKSVLSVFMNYETSIGNFEKFIQGVINNKLKELKDQDEVPSSSPQKGLAGLTRKELEPDWLNKEYVPPTLTPEEQARLEEKRKVLEQTIKDLNKKRETVKPEQVVIEEPVEEIKNESLDSVYTGPILGAKTATKPPKYTKKQVEEFNRAFSTMSGYFPWDDYNEIRGESLDQAQIEAKRRKWEKFRLQTEQERYGRAI